MFWLITIKPILRMKKNLNCCWLKEPDNSFKKLLSNFTIASVLLICSILNLSATSNYSNNYDELQQLKVSGRVTDSQTGNPMPGVNIIVQGSTIGANSDANGNYSILVPRGDVTLIFSFIGYIAQNVPVNGSSSITVALVPEVTALGEVVVTALGIEKATKTLTYATQKISGEEILKVKTVNFVNSMAGKVAGAVITPGTMGPGSATRILIRGDKSFTGNSTPLYVIDGVPTGRGDLLNPEDIESIQILQGASAAALYGSRAANGVILITTKKGKKGIAKITFSSNINFESPSDLPKLQTKYGQTDPLYNDSWGAKITNGSDEHLKEFYNTGVAKINSISISNGNDVAQIYLSYANTAASGIVPENHMIKHNFNVKVTTQLYNDKLSLEFGVNYINQKIYNQNQAMGAGGGANSIIGLISFPVGDDWSKYSGSNFQVWDPVRVMNVQNWPYIRNETFPCQNPYWVQHRNQRDNFLGYTNALFKATYKVLDWLNLMGRVTMDDSYTHEESRDYASTQATVAGLNGGYDISNAKADAWYGDVLLVANKDLGHDFSVSGTAGFSHTSGISSGINLSSTVETSLLYPNFFSVYALNGLFDKSEYLQKAVSEALFANLTLGFKNKLFLDLSGRNEWASTTSQSFFYPSVGLTYILKNSGIGLLSFAKVRASYAEVGNPLPFGIENRTPPYSLDNSGNILGRGSLPYFNGTDTVTLKPERSKSYEFGTDLRFFDDKLSLSLTVYSATTSDQVFQIAAPAGSGATNFWINGGSIRNQGFEGILSYNTSFGALKWIPSLTFSHNKNSIRELSDLLDADYFVVSDFGSSRVVSLFLMRPKDGKYGSYGDMFGDVYVKDENGTILTDPVSGLPKITTTAQEYIGNANPDFLAGFNNTFTYKNFALSFLIDARFGGGIINRTELWLDYKGLAKRTGDARDAGGVVFQGKTLDTKAFYMNQSASGGANGGAAMDAYFWDATNIRMREVSFGYTFSNLKRIFKSIDISLVGRNLFIFYKKAPFDPEIGGNTSQTAEGMSQFTLPATRSVGLNLRLDF
jgi:TonB-linked SusC/RagA family outer membrane protein